jgi:MFS transporter, SP family, arabinose:H+ symporter
MENTTFSCRTTFICAAIAFGGLLFGFDTAVISGAIGLIKLQFALDSLKEGWLVSSGLAGCILGVLVSGVLSNRIGRKKTILLSAAAFLLSGMGCGLAPNIDILVIARAVGGIGVGMASLVCPMLIAELAPADRRGRMIAYYQLAITIGILLAYFSNTVFLAWGQAHGASELWRLMFLAMVVPSALFLLLLIRIPESPRWLVKTHQQARALNILRSLRSPDVAKTEFAAIQTAEQKTSDTKKRDLLERNIRVPLLIGIGLAVFQQFSGINAIIYYGPGIFAAAGIGGNHALVFQVIIGVINLLFTGVAIRYSDRLGRKFLLSTGLIGIVFSLVYCGLLFYSGHTQGMGLLVLLMIYIACFAFSLGPVTWIIINEIFPTRVRVQAVAICTLALWIAVWLVGQFFPWMLQTAGPAVTFWIFAAFSIANFIFSWKIVKETRGKTLEEMEQLFIAPH